MKSKRLYNYKDSLTVPFMVQKLFRGFSLNSPIEISWFAVVGLSILAEFTLLSPVFTFLDVIPGLKLASMFLFPFGMSYLYHNVQPDGLKVHEYVIDFFLYFFGFRLNQFSIYQDDKVEIIKERKVENTANNDVKDVKDKMKTEGENSVNTDTKDKKKEEENNEMKIVFNKLI